MPRRLLDLLFGVAQKDNYPWRIGSFSGELRVNLRGIAIWAAALLFFYCFCVFVFFFVGDTNVYRVTGVQVRADCACACWCVLQVRCRCVVIAERDAVTLVEPRGRVKVGTYPNLGSRDDPVPL